MNLMVVARLVKKVIVVKGVGMVGWWGEFQYLINKYNIEGSIGSVEGLKSVVEEKVGSDWLGSVDGMTSLRSYRMIKEELKPEGYLRLLDSGDVRLRFRLRSGSALQGYWRIRRGVVCVLMIGVCYVIVG